MTTTTCPYCDQPLTVKSRTRHPATCPHRPEVRAAVRTWAEENAIIRDGIAYFPAKNTYVTTKPAGTPAVETLRNTLGSWEDVRLHFAPHLPPLTASPSPSAGKSQPWRALTAAELRAISAANHGSLPPLSAMSDQLSHGAALTHYGLKRFLLEENIEAVTQRTIKNSEWQRISAPNATINTVTAFGKRRDTVRSRLLELQRGPLGIETFPGVTVTWSDRVGRTYTETRYLIR